MKIGDPIKFTDSLGKTHQAKVEKVWAGDKGEPWVDLSFKTMGKKGHIYEHFESSVCHKSRKVKKRRFWE